MTRMFVRHTATISALDNAGTSKFCKDMWTPGASDLQFQTCLGGFRKYHWLFYIAKNKHYKWRLAENILQVNDGFCSKPCLLEGNPVESEVIWLVVWNMCFFLPTKNPTDFYMFQRGRYTTKQQKKHTEVNQLHLSSSGIDLDAVPRIGKQFGVSQPSDIVFYVTSMYLIAACFGMT